MQYGREFTLQATDVTSVGLLKQYVSEQVVCIRRFVCGRVKVL